MPATRVADAVDRFEPFAQRPRIGPEVRVRGVGGEAFDCAPAGLDFPWGDVARPGRPSGAWVDEGTLPRVARVAPACWRYRSATFDQRARVSDGVDVRLPVPSPPGSFAWKAG